MRKNQEEDVQENIEDNYPEVGYIIVNQNFNYSTEVARRSKRNKKPLFDYSKFKEVISFNDVTNLDIIPFVYKTLLFARKCSNIYEKDIDTKNPSVIVQVKVDKHSKMEEYYLSYLDSNICWKYYEILPIKPVITNDTSDEITESILYLSNMWSSLNDKLQNHSHTTPFQIVIKQLNQKEEKSHDEF